jgi:hypothetical protein
MSVARSVPPMPTSPTIGGYLTENCGWQTIFFVKRRR